MRAIILIVFISLYTVNGQTDLDISKDKMNKTEVFRNETYNFFIPLYKAVAYHSGLNFVFSPRSVWLMLAAIAEGCNTETQQQLFKLLNLPDDPFTRQNYYQMMTSRIIPDIGVSLIETRTVFVDENLRLDSAWLNLVSRNSLLDIVTVPIKNSPEFTANWIMRLATTNEPRLDGNSVLLDTIDYNALWDKAFDDAVMENSPFYNKEGKEIGYVDLMRIKRPAKLGYIKSLKTKALELPVGSNSHYRMLFVILPNNTDTINTIKNMTNDILDELFDSLKETDGPIDIAIPRFGITSEIDMSEILKEFGVKNLWADPNATKHISTPSIYPTSYVQRSTFSLNRYGIVPSRKGPTVRKGHFVLSDSKMDKEFIANRPVLMGLFDSETYTPIIAVGLGRPTTYKYGTTYISRI